ncbi:rhodanese [Rhodoblastus acidophilus]|uniref:Rhodanese n=1 Tax=Candidatus Rhodoblastus alkanivorans TaxID=2954117 RepID=A0ABS9ZAS8_9HYPH|nr:rhodanese-like domain-containing protein [Candidatus Rhodoblastus alkanivorans]MCI4680057.1 rhodanese [Candidatus Rhodoblastus alkanivorans]MCI4684805.1 rhodanese [Candidatus Rhodoblastus alkanivorans]MDI4642129.1 rhodanese [Rhodoblastus acidophilus]
MRAKSSFAPVAVLVLGLTGAAVAGTSEPPGLWTGPMHGETPAALAGAKVVDAAAVAELKKTGAVLIDVAEAPAKPPGLSPDQPWLPIHMSIPGAVWFAGGGFGDGSPAYQQRFAARVAELTGGDRSRAVVAFCHPHCWGSWNAGKRLVMLGYEKVYWFPGGVEAWEDRFAAAPVKPDKAWEVSRR